MSDAIVYLNDRNWCGSGGCTTLVFQGHLKGYSFKSKSMIVKKPVLVSDSKSNGWFDLIVNTGSIGTVILAFDGRAYPLNPSMQVLASTGQVSRGLTVLQ